MFSMQCSVHNTISCIFCARNNLLRLGKSCGISVERLRDRTVYVRRKIPTLGGFQTCQQKVLLTCLCLYFCRIFLVLCWFSKNSELFILIMLEEAAKHVREAIMLGRTDIVKKLLEEVKTSLTKGKTMKMSKFKNFPWKWQVFLFKDDAESGQDLYNQFLNGFHSSTGSFLHEAVKVSIQIDLNVWGFS